MRGQTKLKIFKIMLAIITVIMILAIIIYLFPIMKNLSNIESQLQLEQKVENSGFLGLLILFGLEFAQIFLVVLPAEPIEILAGMCYGTVGGTIFIMLSACIISTIIFLAVRKFGKKFIYSFCNEDKVKKIENSKLFQNPGKIEKIMLVLFLIPGAPKDLLVYIAGILPIKPIKFILISTFARFPSVISSTLAGDSIAIGDWKFGILLYAITFVIVGVAIYLINKFDKEKIAEEAMNIIK